MTNLTLANSSYTDNVQGVIYNGLLSLRTVDDLIFIDFIVIYTAVCLFGIVTNSFNVFVYTKMKGRDSVNISLLSLSVTDLLSLYFLLFVSISYYPFWDTPDLDFSIHDIHILMFAWPQFCFRRMSNWITAFITFERCVCIAVPLKVRNVITPRRTMAAMIAIAVAMSLTIMPAYFAATYQWTFDAGLNRTRFRLVTLSNSAVIEKISAGVSLVLTNVTFVWVTTCTVILVTSLYKKSKWRQAATVSIQSDRVTNKEMKVIKMILFLGIIFIVTFTPDVVTLLTMTFDQRVSIYGQYFDLFLLLNGIGEPLLALGSSINFFVYFKMSGNFRKTFYEHCCWISNKP